VTDKKYNTEVRNETDFYYCSDIVNLITSVCGLTVIVLR